MQWRRMEILKYVTDGLRLQDFVSVSQYEPQVRQMGRRPHKTFYSKMWARRFLTRWRQSWTRYIHLPPSKPAFLKSHLQIWRHCFMYRISLGTSPRIHCFIKLSGAIYVRALCLSRANYLPPMLLNEHGWLGQVLDNPEIVIRCPAEEKSIVSTGCRPVLGPTQPPIQRVKEVLAGS